MSIEPRQFGNYLLLDRIGVGGMAEIWRARRFGAAGFQKQLVIKKILQHLADSDEFIRMFIDEAKIAVSLQHANVVQIFDLGAVEREYFIAMEYVPGRDLLNILIRCTQLRIRVPADIAIYIVAETLKGLEAAHTAVDSQGKSLNIIHRDVSPSNVLVGFDGMVKIGDFGVAKAHHREATTRSGTLKGKLGYMSPEQVNGKPIDARADLFSAGIILYEILAMNRLFHAQTELDTMILVRDCDVEPAIARLPSSVEEPLRDILRKALAKNVEDRYQSATEFLEALLDNMLNRRVRVTRAEVAKFMHSIFAAEIEEEAARQREIDALTQGHDPLPDAPPPPVRVNPASRLVFRPTAEMPVIEPQWNADSFFVVRDGEAAMYGPLNLRTLLDLCSYQPSLAHRICVDAQMWYPARILLGHLQTHYSLEEPQPNFMGAFGLAEFPRLFYRYAICKATGRMHIESGGKHKQIYWRRGRPEFVTSNLCCELLSEYLVRTCLATRTQMNDALVSLGDFQGRLDDVLMHRSVLTPHDLFNALSAQAKEMLLELFTWSQGTYQFFTGEHAQARIVPLEISALALINEGICNNMTLEDLKAFFALNEHRPLLRLTHQKLQPQMLQLGPKQLRLWNAVKSGVSLAEQLPNLLAMGASELEVYQVVFLMERLDFAVFG